MAWTVPITEVTGTTILASDWNTYIRDNLNYAFDASGRLIYSNALSLTNQIATLTSDATTTASDTATDTGMSLSLAAGTWFVFTHLIVAWNNGVTTMAATITDGTTVYASQSGTSGGASYQVPLAFGKQITLATTTTLKVQFQGHGTGGTFTVAHQAGSAGNLADAAELIAVRVA